MITAAIEDTLDAEGDEECLHCVLGEIVRDWINGGRVNAVDAASDLARLLADLIGDCPWPDFRQSLLNAVVKTLPELVERAVDGGLVNQPAAGHA